MKKICDLREDLNPDISLLTRNDLKKLSNMRSVFPQLQEHRKSDSLVKQKNPVIQFEQKKSYIASPKIKNSLDSLSPKQFLFGKKDTLSLKSRSDFHRKIHKIPRQIHHNFSGKTGKNFSREKKLQKFIKIFFSTFKNIISYFQDTIQKLEKKWFIFILFFLYFFAFIISFTSAKSGYKNLDSLTNATGENRSIQKIINDAKFDFLVADFFAKPLYIIPGKYSSSFKNLIKGGKSLTFGADSLLGFYHYQIQSLDSEALKNIELGKILSLSKEKITKIHKEILAAKIYYEKVQYVPKKQKENFKNALEKITLSENLLAYTIKNFDALEIALGKNQEKNYLLVFQNNDEIRPMGGFMGSMAVLKIFNGRVKDFIKKDVYAFEWDLKSIDYEKIPAPKGIDELTQFFGLRDANYFVTARESSENIRYFIEKTGQKIDGIIYINQKPILELLEKTGGIYMEDLGKEVNEQNFSELMSLLVEAKIFKVGTLGTPKQILFDFIESYKQKLIQEKNFELYAKVLLKNINSRDIIFYSFDPKAQDFFRGLGASGDIFTDETLDFSYPVFTSLSGNKSDRYMKRSFFQKVEKISACGYQIDFTIMQEHHFDEEILAELKNDIDRYNIQSENIIQIQGNAPNKQFVRVLIPKNSIVEPQEGLEVIDYNRWKSVEFFTLVSPSTTESISFRYQLPNPKCYAYSYHFIKQPGIMQYNFRYNALGIKQDFVQKTTDLWFPLEKRPPYFSLKDTK